MRFFFSTNSGKRRPNIAVFRPNKHILPPFSAVVLTFVVLASLVFFSTLQMCFFRFGFGTESVSVHAEVPKIERIASFTTTYSTSSQNRKHNVALAAKFLDGAVIGTEEEFSFNDRVGVRTSSRGFKEAKVIFGGEFVDGMGGGVCQVSTTLYNCALLADMYVTEVRAHTLPVSYVSPSFDAMVSAYSDLRFVNLSPCSVRISAKADGEKLCVEMWGVKSRTVRRRSLTIEILSAKTDYVDNALLDFGVENVKKVGKNGLRSQGYLDYYTPEGTLLSTRLVREDKYLAQNALVERGTRPLSVPSPDAPYDNQ